MQNGQCVYPDAPASVFEFDGVVEEDPEQVVDEIGDFDLASVLWVAVGQADKELLPDTHLKDGATVVAAAAAECDQIGQELFFYGECLLAFLVFVP